MALSAKDLLPPIKRLLDKVKPGSGDKLPSNVTDDRFLELLNLMVDVVAPQETEADRLPNNGEGMSFLNTGDDIEMSAAMRGTGRPSKRELAEARYFMETGLRLP